MRKGSPGVPGPGDFSETADIATATHDYARRFQGPVGAWFLKCQEAAVLGMLAPHPGATILDVGGGHGQVTPGLIERGHRVTVLGSDPACALRIERFLVDGRCVFQSGSLLALPYDDRAFDVVISLRLLAHVAHWPRFLAELGRVAGRAVIIDYPAVRSLNRMSPYLFRLKRRLEGNTRSFSLFHERQVLEALAPLGFGGAQRMPQFFLPMAVHRALGRAGFSSVTEAMFREVGLTRRFGSPVIVKLIRRSP